MAKNAKKSQSVKREERSARDYQTLAIADRLAFAMPGPADARIGREIVEAFTAYRKFNSQGQGRYVDFNELLRLAKLAIALWNGVSASKQRQVMAGWETDTSIPDAAALSAMQAHDRLVTVDDFLAFSFAGNDDVVVERRFAFTERSVGAVELLVRAGSTRESALFELRKYIAKMEADWDSLIRGRPRRVEELEPGRLQMTGRALFKNQAEGGAAAMPSRFFLEGCVMKKKMKKQGSSIKALQEHLKFLGETGEAMAGTMLRMILPTGHETVDELRTALQRLDQHGEDIARVVLYGLAKAPAKLQILEPEEDQPGCGTIRESVLLKPPPWLVREEWGRSANDDAEEVAFPPETVWSQEIVELASLLAKMGGDHGGPIARLVMSAVAKAPCELGIWTLTGPKGECPEEIDAVRIDRPAWKVPGLCPSSPDGGKDFDDRRLTKKKKPARESRSARKLASKGATKIKGTA